MTTNTTNLNQMYSKISEPTNQAIDIDTPVVEEYRTSDIEVIKNISSHFRKENGYITSISHMSGGLTNRTYRVIFNSGLDTVFRVPGDGTEELISREDERLNVSLASSIGVDAKLLYFDDRGVKVSRYIESETLTEKDMKDLDVIPNLTKILWMLHNCGEKTSVRFDFMKLSEDYLKVIRDNHVPLYDDFEEVSSYVSHVNNRISKEVESYLTTCHNDTLCFNWLHGKDGKYYLIDWEYAGMNDPMWDLAAISIESNYDTVDDMNLLFSYFQCKVGKEYVDRFQANKLYIDYLWSLWGLARYPFVVDKESMSQYARDRYDRLKFNIQRYVLGGTLHV